MNFSTNSTTSFVFPADRPGSISARYDAIITHCSDISRHLTKVTSEFGRVSITSDDPANPFFITGEITADKDVELRNVVLIEANIKSKLGKVDIEGGLIAGDIESQHGITLVNTDQCEQNTVKSSFGSVNLKNSNVGNVEAQKDIHLDSTSTAKEAKSSFGSVTNPGRWSNLSRVSNPDLNGFSTVNDLIAIISDYCSPQQRPARPAIQQRPIRPAITNVNTYGNELVRANTQFPEQPSRPAITNGEFYGNERVQQFGANTAGAASNAIARDSQDQLREAARNFFFRR